MAPLAVALVGVNAPGYRSLALDYLQAAAVADPRLDAAFHRFDVDAAGDPWWTAYRILRLDPAPEVVAMPVFCWTARHVYDTARLVKKARPDVRVVLGGPEVGPIAEQIIEEKSYVDAVVRGEGEFAFRDLLLSYSRDGDPAGLEGITVRDGTKVVSGADREPIEDMDSIPSPYSVRPLATDGSAYIETYRGCPHRCAYCYEGKGSTRIRSFSSERMKSDIDFMASIDGMRSFSFIDPVFNLTGERLRELSEMLAPHAEKGLRLHTIEVDIERVDEEQAQLLRLAGVSSVETGPQTIGTRALETCSRQLDAERFSAGVRCCKDAGISVECDIIVGLPGDDASDVYAAIDFVMSLDPGKVQLSTLHVLPGTVLWEKADELGLVFDPDPPHELLSSPGLSFTELRRIEIFGTAAAMSYRARILPKEQ